MALHQLSGTIIPLKAKNTVIATGGVGHIFGHTSNPSIATGDGIAMALRAGARTRDMAFVQYHPTVLYQPGVSMPFLISEAVRGAGAHIRNAAGERFVLQYDPRGELATRDIVSRCIYGGNETNWEITCFFGRNSTIIFTFSKHISYDP